MNIKDKYSIVRVSSDWIKEIVEEKHYLHRMGASSYCFGLFETYTKDLVGAITYGTPTSPALAKGICGEDERLNVIELTRLWTEDDTPTNTESYLIGNTIPKLNKEILVSFADKSKGHVGTVYQATNWIYTGMSGGGTMWSVKDSNMHPRSLHNVYDTIDDAKEDLGDKLVQVEVSQKHRYVYFNCDKRRKRELMEKLKYDIKEYPKREE
jgi:hypothetical protein